LVAEHIDLTDITVMPKITDYIGHLVKEAIKSSLYCKDQQKATAVLMIE
jgi:hypothetical protein